LLAACAQIEAAKIDMSRTVALLLFFNYISSMATYRATIIANPYLQWGGQHVSFFIKDIVFLDSKNPSVELRFLSFV